MNQSASPAYSHSHPNGYATASGSSPNNNNMYPQQQYSSIPSSSYNNLNSSNSTNMMMNGHQPPSSPYHVPSSQPNSSQQQQQQYYDNSNNNSYQQEYNRPQNNMNHSMIPPPNQNSYQTSTPQYGNNNNNFIYNIPPSTPQQPQQQNYHNGMNGSYQFVNNNNGMMNNRVNNQNMSPSMNQQNSEMSPEDLSPNAELKSGNGNSEFHPIACINCRKMHKQCDKKLPSCQRCLSKGITCEYKTPRRMRYPNQSKQKQPQSTEEQSQSEPKKKKKKTDSKDNLTPKSTSPLDPENACTPPNTTLTSRFPQTLSKKNIIDIYYSMICDHFIFIEKPVLEKYILSKSNSEDVDDAELPLKKEMQTFFYSVTALVEQRMGMAELSEKSAKKARDSLSKLFDEMNNFVVACSYANLGSYEIGSGRVKLSRFYFHNAKFYFESLDDAEKSKLSEYEKALQKYLSSVEIVNADNDLGISAMIHDIPKVFHFTTGHHLPQEIVKATQQEVSPSNCLDYLKIVEMIASYLNKYFRGMATKTRGEKEMEMYDKGSNLCQGLLMNGLRVGVLTKAGYGKDLIEESSLRITYASESEFFPFLPVIVIPHVALAARIHLQIVKKIENGTRQNHQKGLTFLNTVGPIDYFDILAKDYRSLIILSKRFKRVSVCYGSLLDEIKEILGKRVEAQQNNDTTSTNNSVTTPITDDALLQPLSLDSSSLPPLSFLLGSMNDTPPLPQSSSSQKSTLDGYSSNNLQQSIFNSIIQSPIKSPSQQQELYFADPFFTHEDLQQIFSPHTYGDFEDVSEYSFNVK